MRTRKTFYILLAGLLFAWLVFLFGSRVEVWVTPEIFGMIDTDLPLESLAIQIVDKDGTMYSEFPDSTGAFRVDARRSFVWRFSMIGDCCLTSSLSLVTRARKLHSIELGICDGDLNTSQKPAIQLVRFRVFSDRISVKQELFPRRYFDGISTEDWEETLTSFHNSE